MNLDSIRAYCLSFPGATEKVQWENHLLFNVGGKMFVITSLDVSPYVATLKPDPEHRLELLEMEGIEPAAYLARAGWISIRDWDTLRDPEWRDLIAESYRMVISKLPKKLQAELSGTPTAPKKSATTPTPKQAPPAKRALESKKPTAESGSRQAGARPTSSRKSQAKTAQRKTATRAKASAKRSRSARSSG